MWHYICGGIVWVYSFPTKRFFELGKPRNIHRATGSPCSLLAFLVLPPVWWNILPDELHILRNLIHFHMICKMKMFHQTFDWYNETLHIVFLQLLLCYSLCCICLTNTQLAQPHPDKLLFEPKPKSPSDFFFWCYCVNLFHNHQLCNYIIPLTCCYPPWALQCRRGQASSPINKGINSCCWLYSV